MDADNQTIEKYNIIFDTVTNIKRNLFNNSDDIFKNQSMFTLLSSHCDNKDVIKFAALALESAFDYSNNELVNGAPLHLAIKVVLTLIFIIVGCVGLVGNLFTVIVIFKTASLHSHTNCFLASLAISDFCLIVVGVSFDLIYIWRNGDPPPIYGYCSFTSTTISLFTFASILTIVSLTAERFQAICYPFTHRTVFDRRRVMKLIYTIWIVAAIPSLYIGMKFQRVLTDFCGYSHPHQFGSCSLVTNPDSPLRYPVETIMVITFVLPLFFIVFCYCRILATLNEMSASTTVHTPVGTTASDSIQFQFSRSSQNANHSFPLTVHVKNYQPPRSQQAQKMVIKMLFTVTSVFFLCYLPYHIQRLIIQYNKEYCNNSTFCKFLFSVTGLLQYVSATLNPIFYNLMSSRFRNAFNKIIKDFLSKSDKEYGSLARL
ncbi:unnamed protein product [Caenorhabditis angaria]|uniref:G-protein coupled receptors family 1 profile domain-containing protein n=1 Tax=Caenorhabditis angaria TaxID=860376 RepID=A0A9P1J2W3_9PELO|nr:unnamed protein product [Caenorhabditis angaria]